MLGAQPRRRSRPSRRSLATPARHVDSMPLRRPAIMAAITWLPDASARARWNCASSARNSAGVRSGASIASSSRVGADRSGCGCRVGERRRRPRLEDEPRAHDVGDREPARRDLQPHERATCRRRGVAMMIAPALGPEPVPVRMRPSTSSTRSASRTLERPTPSSAASARSPGRRSPGASSPSSRWDSMCSSTTCQARGESDATDATGACVASSAMSDAGAARVASVRHVAHPSRRLAVV